MRSIVNVYLLKPSVSLRVSKVENSSSELVIDFKLPAPELKSSATDFTGKIKFFIVSIQLVRMNHRFRVAN